MQETRQKMKFCSKNGIYKPRDISGAGCGIRTNSKIRLRGGRDHIWMSPSLHPSITNVASIHRKSYEKFHNPLKEFIEDVGDTKKIQNKHSLYQPAKVGIRKIKQVHVPTKFKKVVIPKNNTKLSCPILKNMYIDSTVDSSSTLIMKRRANIKVRVCILFENNIIIIPSTREHTCFAQLREVLHSYF
ncbi:uncharacterized protein LOC117610206 isoform X1 [Osmia lignaria lignaria]|uniref:uncharacterized protein LOC117610206 isoform X1 n=1 Tax=Osmia lignaria lignaria TaxID=1437193 RepID=UPI00402B4B43